LPADLDRNFWFYNQRIRLSLQRKVRYSQIIILADEINRAPAKVQSALFGGHAGAAGYNRRNTFKLDDPFLVMATQNPIEQEGTISFTGSPN